MKRAWKIRALDILIQVRAGNVAECHCPGCGALAPNYGGPGCKPGCSVDTLVKEMIADLKGACDG